MQQTNSGSGGQVSRFLQKMESWFFRWDVRLILVLVAVGLVLRILLALNAPFPYGYSWDPYHTGIILLHQTGEIPESDDCQLCYHPPLLFLSCEPFYALGLALSDGKSRVGLKLACLVPMLCGLMSVWFSYRVVRFFRFRGLELVLGTALALALPCLFISSWGIESDIVLTAVMILFLFFLIRYDRLKEKAGLQHAFLLGLICGLAAAAKFNGLIALVVTALLLAVHLLETRRWRQIFLHGLIILATAYVVGSWKYLDNYRKYDNPLYTTTTAKDGFKIEGRKYRFDFFDFSFPHTAGVVRLMQQDAPEGDLENFKVYRNVLTSLHAQCWTDMSFFSQPSRHGSSQPMYPRRGIPVWLSAGVLYLGWLPHVLAIMGLIITLRRRLFLPVTIFTLISLAVYFNWFICQISWSLKTKYILYLLPAYALYIVLGMRWCRKHLPAWGIMILWGFWAVFLLLLHYYLFEFSVGA